jgi:hypothetical protein
MLSTIDITETSPIHVHGKRHTDSGSLVSAAGLAAVDVRGRAGNYDLLVMQLVRVSKQPLRICQYVFDKHQGDYDVALSELEPD